MSDAVLDAIDNPGAHDNLLGYMRDDEDAEDAIERLLFALPSFAQLECQACGRDLRLNEDDWLAWRLKVEDTDRRRTDLFCGPSCLADSLNAEFEIPITDTEVPVDE